MMLGIKKDRFYFIAITLIIMWLGVMFFFYLKADEVTRDPCSICSERHGEQVVCTVGSLIPTSRTYYPNGSIVDALPNIKRDVPIINASKMLADTKIINSSDN